MDQAMVREVEMDPNVVLVTGQVQLQVDPKEGLILLDMEKVVVEVVDQEVAQVMGQEVDLVMVQVVPKMEAMLAEVVKGVEGVEGMEVVGVIGVIGFDGTQAPFECIPIVRYFSMEAIASKARLLTLVSRPEEKESFLDMIHQHTFVLLCFNYFVCECVFTCVGPAGVP